MQRLSFRHPRGIRRRWLARTLAAFLATAAFSSVEHDHSEHDHSGTDGRVYPQPKEHLAADADPARNSLPPPEAGVADLKFGEIYRMPVGPRGLEFSEKALELSGKRVRILGYMVREDLPQPGRLLLAPQPFTLFTEEYGLAEDLPGSVVHAFLPGADGGNPVPLTPGLLLLTGRLEIGNREEPDGRISSVRLLVDPPPSGEAVAGS